MFARLIIIIISTLLFFNCISLFSADENLSFEETQKKAEQGDAVAQNDLGDCYYDGKGTAKDQANAFEWYMKSALQGNALAQHHVGRCYRYGVGTVKDEIKSFEWYLKAAEQADADADAQIILGICYEQGEGIAKDETKAFEWYAKAAGQGDATAQYLLAYCHLRGIGTVKDETKAFNWYMKAAEQGDASAQYRLGNCYYYGEGIEEDDVKAVEWYRKAALHGSAGAQYNLGNCYRRGEGVFKNEDKAINWYRKAARQGDDDAEYRLGNCYRQGRGTAKDEAKAFEWYKKAAEQGNSDAQYYLGLCYGKGSGVAHDRMKSFEWFKKAAEQKNNFASIQMACFYLGADGFEEDTEKAMSYLGMAAENGSYTAQLVGANAYLTGYCVLKDLCNNPLIVKAVPKDLNKAIKYTKMGLGNSSMDCVGKFFCASIAMCGHARKGELKEACKIAVEHPAVGIVGIGLFAVLIATLLLEMAIIFWFYRRTHKVQSDGGPWRLSDFILLLLLGIPLGILSGIVPFLLPLHTLTSALIPMILLHGAMVLLFIFILRKRGATVVEAFALRMIPLKTFLKWTLICLGAIIVSELAYNCVCYFLGIKLDDQLVVDLFSSKSLVGAELVFVCIAISFVIPILEEFIFRGIIYQSLKTKMRPWIAITISSLIFAAVHVSLSVFIPLFVMGAIFAYSLEKTKSLYLPICLHCVNNTAMVAIMLFCR